MASVPELDPPAVAALAQRLSENISRAVKVPEGALRNIWDGSCCDNATKEKEQQVCSGGVWQPTGNYSCSGPCGPRDPWPPIQ